METCELSSPHAVTVDAQTQENARPVTSSSVGNVGVQLSQTGTVATPSMYHQSQVYGFLVEIAKDFEMCCAHHLPKHPGKCKNPHGHNYKIEVYMRSYINPETGMVADFDYLTGLVQAKVIAIYDHRDLNYFFETPTAEVLAWTWLHDLLQFDSRFSKVVVWETSKCRAIASKY